MNAPVYKADPGIGREEDPIGSVGWAQRVRLQLQTLVNHGIDAEGSDLKSLRRFVDLVRGKEAWRLMNRPDGSFFATFEEFCEHRQPWGLGRPWPRLRPFVEVIVGDKVGVDNVKATVAALTTSAAAAPTKADAASKAGKAGGRSRRKVDKPRDERNAAIERGRGNDPEYLAARIARDAPAVHEDMKAGKFKSVHAAAKAAGIVKDPDLVTVAARHIARVPTHRLAELAHAIPKETRRMLRMVLDDAGAA